MEHLHAIANAAARPPPRLVDHPRIEIVPTAHHGHLLMYIHLAHLLENPEHGGDAAAILVPHCVLDDIGCGICEIGICESTDTARARVLDMQAERGWFENVARYCCPWWRAAHQRDHTACFLLPSDEDAAAGAARLPGRVGVGLFDGSS